MEHLPRIWLPLGELPTVSPIQTQATCLGLPCTVHLVPPCQSVHTYEWAYADVITKFFSHFASPWSSAARPRYKSAFRDNNSDNDSQLDYFPHIKLTLTEKTYLHSLRSVNMNESDLRVNSLPYITTVWVNYLLTLKNTRQILKPRSLKIWMLEPKQQHQHQSTTVLIYML